MFKCDFFRILEIVWLILPWGTFMLTSSWAIEYRNQCRLDTLVHRWGIIVNYLYKWFCWQGAQSSIDDAFKIEDNIHDLSLYWWLSPSKGIESNSPWLRFTESMWLLWKNHSQCVQCNEERFSASFISHVRIRALYLDILCVWAYCDQYTRGWVCVHDS